MKGYAISLSCIVLLYLWMISPMFQQDDTISQESPGIFYCLFQTIKENFIFFDQSCMRINEMQKKINNKNTEIEKLKKNNEKLKRKNTRKTAIINSLKKANVLLENEVVGVKLKLEKKKIKYFLKLKRYKKKIGQLSFNLDNSKKENIELMRRNIVLKICHDTLFYNCKRVIEERDFLRKELKTNKHLVTWGVGVGMVADHNAPRFGIFIGINGGGLLKEILR